MPHTMHLAWLDHSLVVATSLTPFLRVPPCLWCVLQSQQLAQELVQKLPAAALAGLVASLSVSPAAIAADYAPAPEANTVVAEQQQAPSSFTFQGATQVGGHTGLRGCEQKWDGAVGAAPPWVGAWDSDSSHHITTPQSCHAPGCRSRAQWCSASTALSGSPVLPSVPAPPCLSSSCITHPPTHSLILVSPCPQPPLPYLTPSAERPCCA